MQPQKPFASGHRQADRRCGQVITGLCYERASHAPGGFLADVGGTTDDWTGDPEMIGHTDGCPTNGRPPP